MFMNFLEVLDGSTDQNAPKLQNYIYDLVQAAIQYHKNMVEILKSIGFEGGDVNPCLYMKRDKNGLIYVALCVGDNLLIGNEKAINETIKALKKAGFVLKLYDSLKNYLSCEIKLSKDRNIIMARTTPSY